MELIYLYFMNRDLSGYNPRHLPKTEAKDVIKMAHRSNVYAFMQCVAQEPDLVSFREGAPNRIPGAFLCKIYHEWMRTQPGHVIKNEVTQNHFNRELRAAGFETVVINAAAGSAGPSTSRGFNFGTDPRAFIKSVLVKAGKWDADQE